MRWLSYDALELGVMAAVAVVFMIVDYVWYKRQLAKQAKLANDEPEALCVTPRTPRPRIDSEPLRTEQPDDPP